MQRSVSAATCASVRAAKPPCAWPRARRARERHGRRSRTAARQIPPASREAPAGRTAGRRRSGSRRSSRASRRTGGASFRRAPPRRRGPYPQNDSCCAPRGLQSRRGRRPGARAAARAGGGAGCGGAVRQEGFILRAKDLQRGEDRLRSGIEERGLRGSGDEADTVFRGTERGADPAHLAVDSRLAAGAQVHAEAAGASAAPDRRADRRGRRTRAAARRPRRGRSARGCGGGGAWGAW